MGNSGWFSVPYSCAGKTVFVAGHGGMVGSALVRRLEREDCLVLTAPRDVLDCRDQEAVQRWMRAHKPDIVIVAAAKVGGIAANIAAPAQFLYDNLMIAAHIIHSAHDVGVDKLLYLGSSCMYPKDAPNPLKPAMLLSGAFEPTNAPYALAKMAGIELCRTFRAQYGCDFISAIPCNLYGEGDNFDPETAHVIPALISKAHAAKLAGAPQMEVWGSGQPLREFLYADDLADALVFLLQHYSGAAPINIGAGEDISIAALATLVADVVGYRGQVVFNPARPDGVMRKLMDTSPLNQAGWAPRTSLREGIARSYDWFVKNASIITC